MLKSGDHGKREQVILLGFGVFLACCWLEMQKTP